jgi:hypothetical protein
MFCGRDTSPGGCRVSVQIGTGEEDSLSSMILKKNPQRDLHIGLLNT